MDGIEATRRIGLAGVPTRVLVLTTFDADEARVPPGLEGLSDREIEVLRLVGAARSNAEIAEELVISPATVKSHVRHILAKLALRGRRPGGRARPRVRPRAGGPMRDRASGGSSASARRR